MIRTTIFINLFVAGMLTALGLTTMHAMNTSGNVTIEFFESGFNLNSTTPSRETFHLTPEVIKISPFLQKLTNGGVQERSLHKVDFCSLSCIRPIFKLLESLRDLSLDKLSLKDRNEVILEKLFKVLEDNSSLSPKRIISIFNVLEIEGFFKLTMFDLKGQQIDTTLSPQSWSANDLSEWNYMKNFPPYIIMISASLDPKDDVYYLYCRTLTRWAAISGKIGDWIQAQETLNDSKENFYLMPLGSKNFADAQLEGELLCSLGCDFSAYDRWVSVLKYIRRQPLEKFCTLLLIAHSLDLHDTSFNKKKNLNELFPWIVAHRFIAEYKENPTLDDNTREIMKEMNKKMKILGYDLKNTLIKLFNHPDINENSFWVIGRNLYEEDHVISALSEQIAQEGSCVKVEPFFADLFEIDVFSEIMNSVKRNLVKLTEYNNQEISDKGTMTFIPFIARLIAPAGTAMAKKDEKWDGQVLKRNHNRVRYAQFKCGSLLYKIMKFPERCWFNK